MVGVRAPVSRVERDAGGGARGARCPGGDALFHKADARAYGCAGRIVSLQDIRLARGLCARIRTRVNPSE